MCVLAGCLGLAACLWALGGNRWRWRGGLCHGLLGALTMLFYSLLCAWPLLALFPPAWLALPAPLPPVADFPTSKVVWLPVACALVFAWLAELVCKVRALGSTRRPNPTRPAHCNPSLGCGGGRDTRHRSVPCVSVDFHEEHGMHMRAHVCSFHSWIKAFVRGCWFVCTLVRAWRSAPVHGCTYLRI